MTLGMFALVVFILVYVSVIGAMFAGQLDRFTRDSSGGFNVVVSSNPTSGSSSTVAIPNVAGNGGNPVATDVVKVHYEGKLIDGTVFDSSIKRNEPAEFPLNGVVPCWREAVQKMKKGEKSQIVCPSDLAYGDAGQPPDIPPGATLSFEVELLDFHKP